MHEMKFTPVIHEVNLRGTRHPIVAKATDKASLAMRRRMEEKMNMIAGDFGNLADQHNGDPAILGNLPLGSYEG